MTRDFTIHILPDLVRTHHRDESGIRQLVRSLARGEKLMIVSSRKVVIW